MKMKHQMKKKKKKKKKKWHLESGWGEGFWEGSGGRGIAGAQR